MIETPREEVNTQELPTLIPQITNVQPLDKVAETTSDKVDTAEKDTVETQATTKEQSQTTQIILSAPLAQAQGASQNIMKHKDKPKETEMTPKVKEKVAIQALVTLPKSVTPSIHTL